MKELYAQLKENTLLPASESDSEALKAFKPNQVLRLQVYGVKKPRSYHQLQKWKASCRTLFDNTELFNSAAEAEEYVKLKIGWVEFIVYISGVPHPKTKSVSYAAMDHFEACNKMTEGFELIAKMLGITVNELDNNL
jgi:hypothetical protein